MKAVPRSRATRAVGVQQGALRVQIAAPPHEGQSNAALCAYLAEAAGVRPRAARIRRGSGGARKLVEAGHQHGEDAEGPPPRLGLAPLAARGRPDHGLAGALPHRSTALPATADSIAATSRPASSPGSPSSSTSLRAPPEPRRMRAARGRTPAASAS